MTQAMDSNLAVVLNGRAKSVNDRVVELMRSLVHEDDLYVSSSLSLLRTRLNLILSKQNLR